MCALALSNIAGAPVHAVMPGAADLRPPGTIVLDVDATDLSRQIFRMHMSMPVRPGPLTLFYPQWLPGNHGPNGPVSQLAGLFITGGGRRVEWTRDPMNMFAFHVLVPEGVSMLELEYQYLSPLAPNQGRITMTDAILGIQWPSVTLYPAGYPAQSIQVQANVRLPAGWSYGTALETAHDDHGTAHFKPTDLDTLIDSPVFAGRYFRRIDLAPGDRAPVFLDLFADTPESLDAKPAQIAAHRAMVSQALMLFGAHHYDHYDFLFALSDEFGGIGREHHQSSENADRPAYFTDWDRSEEGRDLLPHEFVHSWNGKFRRPLGQDVANFNQPFDNRLLWVYEGQTQYWGNVLTARSGMVTAQGARDALAAAAARSSEVAGRRWRTLQDTVYDPILNGHGPLDWSTWQRSEDYYTDGQFLWLDVDTKIRELSQDRRSLNDFARAFFGVMDGSRRPVAYNFDDIVATLNSVQAFDWAGFLRTRLDENLQEARVDGLARAGWRLIFTDTPSDYTKAIASQSGGVDLHDSLGLTANLSGAIRQVVWDGIAFRAGLAANASIVAVNERAYTPQVLKQAVQNAKTDTAPIRLLLKKGGALRSVELDYHGGLRYPHLERIPGTRDRLSEIFAPLK